MNWNLRLNPKILDVFSQFWKVKPEELITSFDGASIELKQKATSRSWYHVDHSYVDSKFKKLQSWVTAFDVESGDATLVVLDSSHKLHSEFRYNFDITNFSDFYLVNNLELEFYKTKYKCIEKKICCPKGSLVLWDSRTVHYGANYINKKNIRCISYLCFIPRIYCSTKILEYKQIAFENLDTTLHVPTLCRLKPKTPYGENDDENLYITKINKPHISELGRKLCGF
jgi:hypothetical protein